MSRNFKRFQYFTFTTDFLENKNLFRKTGRPFLVDSTKTEIASFPYKAAISEANVKTNRMVTTKWTHHKEQSFVSNYFIFLKILLKFKNLSQRVDLVFQPMCPYPYFLKALKFNLTVIFPCEYP